MGSGMLLAQEMTLSEGIVRMLSNNFFWVAIVLIVAASSIPQLVRYYFLHRERMAMIQAGLHPDAYSRTQYDDVDEEEEGCVVDLKAEGKDEPVPHATVPGREA
jgi:hypothetical protein